MDKSKQREILSTYRNQMADEGVFFKSFKFGENDNAKNGRAFYCHTPASLKKLIEDVGGYDILELYVTEDVRKGRENEKWCSAVIKRAVL